METILLYYDRLRLQSIWLLFMPCCVSKKLTKRGQTMQVNTTAHNPHTYL